MRNQEIGPDAMRASIQAVERSGRDIELVVRLSNTSARTLHYISDVRVTRYDAGTKTLTVALSDEGRQVIPTTVGAMPVFRHVDPGSDVELRLRLPDRLIRFSRSAPPGELAFEAHRLSEMEQVVIEIAWADVPYYEDTRRRDDARLPAARWQQHLARATTRVEGGPKERRREE